MKLSIRLKINNKKNSKRTGYLNCRNGTSQDLKIYFYQTYIPNLPSQ